MVQIVLKMVERAHLREDALDDVLVIVDDVVERIGGEVVSCLQIEEFTEGESAQIIGLHNAVQLGVFLLQSHDGRTSEDNLQAWVSIVAKAQLATPVGVLKHLVNQQYSTSTSQELACKVGNTTTLEVEVIQIDIQARTIATEALLGILQQEGCLAHATRALDAYQAGIPIYLVHQIATDKGGTDVLYQVIVCAIKDFHFSVH